MLGIRLNPDLEADLTALARRTHRTKSDVAREAVREYVDRHSLDAEYRRQVALVHEAQRGSDMDWLEAMAADLMADEPDYDWGDRKP
ncbi:ribbon-helix-helix protein, CopG family [Sphingomonas arantia]|uniref:Ribbon-helix-helix protein, CopG family n=1 Tax=Sphingomonas arantia TaxID=1460676 RepID=A0ABW4U1N8_9SPHN